MGLEVLGEADGQDPTSVEEEKFNSDKDVATAW